MVRVSVIIRTLARRPALLRQAVESVLAQTTPPTELLVVEDGGSSLSTFVDELAPPPATVVRHLPQARIGRSGTGNVGMEEAMGDALCLLDDDDWLYPRHLEILIAALDSHPDAVAAYALAHEVSVRPAVGDGIPAEVGRRTIGRVPFSRADLWISNTMPIQSVVFRRALFEALGGISPELDALEDWDLWLRYSAAGDFIGVPEISSAYRMPADRGQLRLRATSHEAALPLVLERHRGLAANFSMDEIRALDAGFRARLDDYVGARWCMGRIIRRIFGGR